MTFDTDTENFLNAEFLKEDNPEKTKMDYLVEWTGLEEHEIKKWFRLKRRKISCSAIVSNESKINSWFEKFPYLSYLSETEKQEITTDTGMTMKALFSLWNKKRDQAKAEGTLKCRDKERVRRSAKNDKILYEFFDHKMYPTDEEYNDLSIKTGMTIKKLRNWFVNRRGEKKYKNIDKNLTETQKSQLLNFWSENVEPIREELDEIAFITGLELKDVKLWFSGKRHEERIKIKHDMSEHNPICHKKEHIEILKKYYNQDCFLVTGAKDTQEHVKTIVEELGGALSKKQVISWFQCKRSQEGKTYKPPELTNEKYKMIEQEFLIDENFSHFDDKELRVRCTLVADRVGVTARCVKRVRKELLEKHKFNEEKEIRERIMLKHFEESIYCDTKRANMILEEIRESISTSNFQAIQVRRWFASYRIKHRYRYRVIWSVQGYLHRCGKSATFFSCPFQKKVKNCSHITLCLHRIKTTKI